MSNCRKPFVWGSAMEGCTDTDLIRLEPYCGPLLKEDQNKRDPLTVRPVTSSGATKQDFIQKLEEDTEKSICNFQHEIFPTGIVKLTATFGRHYFFKKEAGYEVSKMEHLIGGKMKRAFCHGGIPRNVDFIKVVSDLSEGAVTNKRNIQYSVRLASRNYFHVKQKEDNTFECLMFQKDVKFLTFTLHRAVSANLDLRLNVRRASVGKIYCT